LIASHPAHSLTFLLSGVFLLADFLWTRKLRKIRSHKKLYPASWLALIGCICAAAGILMTSLYELQLKRDTITIITLGLAALSVVCLVLLGIGRLKGLRPNFLMQAVVTVYLMFHLVSQYRLWSSEPQLQVYCFQLLASVFLMLSVFHGTVLDTQVGSRRMFVFFNQGALFFCCMSFAAREQPKMTPVRLVLIVDIISTSLCSETGTRLPPHPALFTRTSISPMRENTLSQSEGRVTSAQQYFTPSSEAADLSLSSLRPVIQTSAPHFFSTLAMPLP
jgi:hypothetical protein